MALRKTVPYSQGICFKSDSKNISEKAEHIIDRKLNRNPRFPSVVAYSVLKENDSTAVQNMCFTLTAGNIFHGLQSIGSQNINGMPFS